MNLSLLLQGNPTYQWTAKDSLHFLGYFFDENNDLYRGYDAIEFLNNQLLHHILDDILKKIDGLFSIVIQEEKNVVLVSDVLNTFPLFYCINNGTLYISDFWDTIIENTNTFDLNTNAIAEYKTAGFVLLNETLAQSVFKTNASEILTLGENTSNKTYQNFINNHFSSKPETELAKDAESTLLKVGQKLVNFLNPRTAVVPLSGGYDSRLIVSLLKRLDYDKVICFTYGKPNPEVKISEMVAKELGYDWYFIDFTTLNIPKIQQQEHYQHYLNFAANGFSMPYLMEYYATLELINQQLIPKDSVFLPGHSGDFLGGSYILKTVKNNLKTTELPAFIEGKYFNFVQKNNSQKLQIQKRLSESLQPIGSHLYEDYNMTVEQWDIQEKLSKFIFHSSQVFTYFGFEHYFPLWDKELRDFFRQVPFKHREAKQLYDKVLEQYFFSPQQISFQKKELKVSNLQRNFQIVKDAIRYHFPWEMVIKRINAADWPDYQSLTKTMLQDIETQQKKKFTHFKAYNAVICNWYVQFLNNKYSKKS